MSIANAVTLVLLGLVCHTTAVYMLLVAIHRRLRVIQTDMSTCATCLLLLVKRS
jgi:hypothetical protein